VPASPYKILPGSRAQSAASLARTSRSSSQGGMMVRLHTLCEALWQQEREA